MDRRAWILSVLGALALGSLACRSAGMDEPADPAGEPAMSGGEVAGADPGEAEGSADASEPSEGEPSENEPSEGEVPEADEKLENTLRWKTASEVDNFGFDVYRGLSEDGPFERLTDEPIPGAVTTDEPQSYVFVDDTIEPGVVYWYYVESISLAGVREQFTPVFRAKAKGVGEAEGSGDE